MFNKRARQAGLVIAALALVAASCGGSDEEAASTATKDTIGADQRAAETTTTTEATITTVEETTTTTEPNPFDEFRPELELAAVSAGPISLTPTLCDVGDWDFVTQSEPEAIGVSGNHVFVASDSEAHAFTFDTSSGCTLTPNLAVGDDGVVTSEEDSLYTISGGSNGNMLISWFYDSLVVDVETGQSFTCDDLSGYTLISPDGTGAFDWWVGDLNNTFELTKSKCTKRDEELELPDSPGSIRGAYRVDDARLGFEIYVEQGEDAWTAAALYGADRTKVWQVGVDSGEEGPFFASIDGIFPCGANVCVNDGFFGGVFVFDDSGELLAELDGEELSDGEGDLSIVTADSEGNLFGIISVYVGLDTEEPDHYYYNYVVKLEATS